jgi:hypothetical protein
MRAAERVCGADHICYVMLCIFFVRGAGGVVVVFITPGITDLIGPMATLNCSRIPAFNPIYTKESPTAVPNLSALALLA